MKLKIPLPWLQLSHQRLRLLIALAGIGFADILMFLQLGFREALFDSATQIHKQLIGDVVLISSQSEALHRMATFSRRRLYQTLSLEQVESIAPIYIGAGEWKNPELRNKRRLIVFGFNPAKLILDLPRINQNLSQLKLQDVVLFDAASRSEFGPIPELFAQGQTIKTELNGKEVTVGGLFTLGTSFAADGNVIVSDLNFLRIFPDRKPGEINLGLIQLKSGADAEAVQTLLQANLGNDVRVLTHKEFIEFEKNYWANSTAIGFIFSLGTAMGFIVGAVIVYQILYSDVSDHLPEYATLKAMGYTDKYLMTVVLQEALILAIIGYLPGFTISIGLYGLIKAGTHLPMAMNLGRATVVFILTVLMCFGSGAIAIRRLGDADPADIF